MSVKKILLYILAVGLIVACILCLSSCVQDPQAASANDRVNTFVITNIDQRDGQKNTARYRAECPDNIMGNQTIWFNDSVGKFIIGDAIRFQLIKQ